MKDNVLSLLTRARSLIDELQAHIEADNIPAARSELVAITGMLGITSRMLGPVGPLGVIVPPLSPSDVVMHGCSVIGYGSGAFIYTPDGRLWHSGQGYDLGGPSAFVPRSKQFIARLLCIPIEQVVVKSGNSQ